MNELCFIHAFSFVNNPFNQLSSSASKVDFQMQIQEIAIQEIETIATSGESETLEFKKATSQLSRVGETLCGFLNNIGGRVLIGVGADGKFIGQHISDSTLREVATMLAKLNPPNMVTMERVGVEGEKEILILTAHANKKYRPCTFDGRPFQRVGSTTTLMPPSTYERLLSEKLHATHRWENEEAQGYRIEDLDHEEILRTVRLGVQVGRIPESIGTSIPDILDRLGVRKDGVLLRSAVVLFGTDFRYDYPQCALRLARFRGIDISEFLDEKQLKGHAFHLFEEAMLFLNRHLPVAKKILPNVVERQDKPLFPLDALREALVNALCHRLYTRPGGAISVAVFDDRLEIWSDGILPFDQQPEELKKNHRSQPRNPDITNVFYRRGLIEHWGRGTQKIVALCVQAGHPEPEFFQQAGSFVVRFIPKGYVAPTSVAHPLTERQRQILNALAYSVDLSFLEIKTKILNPPADRTLQEDLYHLKILNMIHSRGRGRNARWYLVRNPKE